MRPFFLILYGLPVFALASCASPRPISMLESHQSGHQFWHQGQEYLQQSFDQLTLEIAYSREAGEYYIFDLAVYNETSEPVLVDPVSFYYVPIRNKVDSLSVVVAEDPENRLLELDKELSRLKAKEINQSISDAIMATAELSAIAASELGDSSKEEKEELRTSVSDSRYERKLERAELEWESLESEEQREFWSKQTLRKTTLFPGQYITGQIFFKRNTKADGIILHLPLKDERFIFSYTQKLVKVR